MRGGLAPMGRGGPAVMPSNEATARPYSHPCPYDGWNARGNLANMKPTEAIQMDNVFPGVQTTGIRKGSAVWATGLLYGPELVINGDGSSTVGWTANNGAVLTSTGGRLRVTNSIAANGGGYQSFTTVIGKVYQFRITRFAGTGGAWIQVGSTGANSSDLLNQLGGVGSIDITITAATVTTTITLIELDGVNGNYAEFDNISFRATPSNFHSMLPYSGLTTNKLFVSTTDGIFDVTAGGAIGAPAVACTNGYWESLNMATAGGNFLFAVNGTDPAKTFDGAAWAVPAITVATSSTWSYITLHKHRIWAVEKNTMNLWYLPIDSIAGAATKFPVGSLFKKGGYVVAIGSWTIDSGVGIDDIFVIVTSNGEIAAYQGTDPSSSSTWALIGVYNVAQPVGKKPLLDFGGDLLYLNANGLLPLSKLMQSAIIDQSAQISYNIDGAFMDAADNYKNILGWQMLTHKTANLLIVNIPVSLDTVAYQFVMNTTTKKWCRFTGWNAACWAEFNGLIYYAGGTTVYQAWTGVTDAGVPITGSVAQAYAPLGSRGQTNITLARPNFGIAGSAQISMSIDADFRTFNGDTTYTYAPASNGAIWSTGIWDTGLWASDNSIFEPKWTTIPGDLGYLHSFRLQIVTSSGNFIWTSTDFAFRGAGIL